MESKKVSIIVPFRVVDKYVIKCVNKCLELDWDNFEIMLLPDSDIESPVDDDRIKIIPTGSVKPSIKRNLAIEKSEAEILAFIDADAYPTDKNWIKNALKYFKDSKIGAVGGPNITPLEDSIGQKISGEIFSSFVASGPTAFRYLARHKFRQGLPVKEMPSCNLFVVKIVALDVGGFDGKFLTGEDAKFCFQIRKKGLRLINAWDVEVYHHRRELFWAHFKQVWIYGRDKAWLVKEDFSPSKIFYAVPSLFVIGLIGGIFVWPSQILRNIYLAIVAIYFVIIIIASISKKGAIRFLVGTILTHLTYGIGFIYGMSFNMKE